MNKSILITLLTMIALAGFASALGEACTDHTNCTTCEYCNSTNQCDYQENTDLKNDCGTCMMCIWGGYCESQLPGDDIKNECEPGLYDCYEDDYYVYTISTGGCNQYTFNACGNDGGTVVDLGNVCVNSTHYNVDPSPARYCGIWSDCVEGSMSAGEYYVGYDAWYGCDETGWVSTGSNWNTSSGFFINTTEKTDFCIEEAQRGSLPTATIFNGSSTNFSAVFDLTAVSGLVLEDTSYGKISWNQAVNVSGVDLDSYVYFSDNLVGLDSSSLPNLNVSANISIYVSGLSNPVIFRDGVLCEGSICAGITYVDDKLSFSVTQFSNYSGNSSSLFDGNIESGSYYLDQNYTINSTQIVESDVLIDCQGYTLVKDFSDVLFNLNSNDNITLSDCVMDSNAGTLINTTGGGNILVDGLVISGTGSFIQLNTVSIFTFSNNLIENAVLSNPVMVAINSNVFYENNTLNNVSLLYANVTEFNDYAGLAIYVPDLQAVNLSLENSYGIIHWDNPINISAFGDFDRIIEISNRTVIVNPETADINGSARITFYSPGFSSQDNFQLWKNNNLCSLTDCTGLTIGTNNVSVEVLGFSSYELKGFLFSDYAPTLVKENTAADVTVNVTGQVSSMILSVKVGSGNWTNYSIANYTGTTTRKYMKNLMGSLFKVGEYLYAKWITTDSNNYVRVSDEKNWKIAASSSFGGGGSSSLPAVITPTNVTVRTTMVGNVDAFPESLTITRMSGKSIMIDNKGNDEIVFSKIYLLDGPSPGIIDDKLTVSEEQHVLPGRSSFSLIIKPKSIGRVQGDAILVLENDKGEKANIPISVDVTIPGIIGEAINDVISFIGGLVKEIIA